MAVPQFCMVLRDKSSDQPRLRNISSQERIRIGRHQMNMFHLRLLMSYGKLHSVGNMMISWLAKYHMGELIDSEPDRTSLLIRLLSQMSAYQKIFILIHESDEYVSLSFPDVQQYPCRWGD